MFEPFSRARCALRRSFLPLVLLLAVSAATATESATKSSESDRGEGLYENHCGDCHDASVHRRAERLVNSREALYGWVAAWSVHAGLNWSAEDIESVTSYLSRRLYGFTR